MSMDDVIRWPASGSYLCFVRSPFYSITVSFRSFVGYPHSTLDQHIMPSLAPNTISPQQGG